MPGTLTPSSTAGRKRKGAVTKDIAETVEGGAKDSTPKKRRKGGKEAEEPVDQRDDTDAVAHLGD